MPSTASRTEGWRGTPRLARSGVDGAAIEGVATEDEAISGTVVAGDGKLWSDEAQPAKTELPVVQDVVSVAVVFCVAVYTVPLLGTAVEQELVTVRMISVSTEVFEGAIAEAHLGGMPTPVRVVGTEAV